MEYETKFETYVNYDALFEAIPKPNADLTVLFRIAGKFGSNFIQSRKVLAQAAKVSPRTIDRFISRTSGKVLTVSRRFNEYGGSEYSEYTLNPDIIRTKLKENAKS